MTHSIVEVNADDAGQRLDRWLKKQRPDLPYVLLQKLLRKGQIRVNGKRAGPDTRLEKGQQIKMPLGTAEGDREMRAHHKPDGAWLRQLVVYEDDDLLVLNKPSGLAVQGGSGLTVHLEMLLDEFMVQGVKPRLVHRIDRETSGLLVLARSAAMARKMMDIFRDRAIEKTYLALCSPPPVEKEGHIDLALDKVNVGTDIEKMQVVKNGRAAQTGYRVISVNGSVALVEFRPLTGRTHQIRVHAAALGFPLLGDKKYGGDCDVLKTRRLPQRVHLHAHKLVFPHPKTGGILELMAPLTDDLCDSWTVFEFPLS